MHTGTIEQENLRRAKVAVRVGKKDVVLGGGYRDGKMRVGVSSKRTVIGLRTSLLFLQFMST